LTPQNLTVFVDASAYRVLEPVARVGERRLQAMEFALPWKIDTAQLCYGVLHLDLPKDSIRVLHSENAATLRLVPRTLVAALITLAVLSVVAING
jgi:hypothetical protein